MVRSYNSRGVHHFYEIISVGATAIEVELDSLWFEIIYFVFIVPVRCHRFVRECKTKGNKSDVLWEDIDRTGEGVMENVEASISCCTF
jgi:hypothetical protein